MTQPAALVGVSRPDDAAAARQRVQASVSILGVVLYLGPLAVLCAQLTGIHVLAHTAGAPVSDPGSPPVYATTMLMLLIVKTLCHELGHVLVGRLRGMTWPRWSISRSGTPSVTLTRADRPRTNLEQLLISIAGPFADLAYGLALLSANALLELPGWGPVSVAGWTAISAAILAFLLPLKASSDGARGWYCLWLVLTRRGHLAYAGA